MGAVRDYRSVLEGAASNSYAVFAHTPAATPTDLFTIQGSATRTVRLLRLMITGRATAATWYRLRLLFYTVFLTGGTPVVVAPVPYDTTDPTPTAVINTWAGGLPAVGATLVGAIQDDMLPLQAAALTATQPFSGPPGLLYDFTQMGQKPPTLRGIAQYLAINAAGVALPAGIVLDIKATTSEE